MWRDRSVLLNRGSTKIMRFLHDMMWGVSEVMGDLQVTKGLSTYPLVMTNIAIENGYL